MKNASTKIKHMLINIMIWLYLTIKRCFLALLESETLSYFERIEIELYMCFQVQSTDNCQQTLWLLII